MDPETLWSDRRHQRGRPPAHTREAVVAEAVGVADTEGLSAVTMRRVATALGSGTMSLYTYVSERDALLELMVDAVTGEQDLPPATGDWRADLAAFARGQRALMRRHPWLPVALTGRRTLGPNTLKALDHALALLAPTGLPPQSRLEAFALVSGFVASHVGYEVAQEQALGRAEDAKEFAESNARYMTRAVASGAYPHLAEAMAASGAGPAPEPDATFERLLARVINGLT
ncbi:TetR/AcrR family transcriptional regulator [Catenulispora subtropica]|uniref:TetR/AcrR family transcriptional regulator C-terminal domain-containing protein n=1 Tax=Catenulispora subtropica TaxID=450798 RepID=A0ABP5DKL2_9ACTN